MPLNELQWITMRARFKIHFRVWACMLYAFGIQRVVCVFVCTSYTSLVQTTNQCEREVCYAWIRIRIRIRIPFLHVVYLCIYRRQHVVGNSLKLYQCTMFTVVPTTFFPANICFSLLLMGIQSCLYIHVKSLASGLFSHKLSISFERATTTPNHSCKHNHILSLDSNIAHSI